MKTTPELLIDWSPSPECDSAMVRTCARRYAFSSQNVVPGAVDGWRIPTFAPIVDDVGKQLDADQSIDTCILDFEKAFDEVLTAGPTDDRYAGCVKDMLGLLGELRRNFPRLRRLTYFGGPSLALWHGDGAPTSKRFILELPPRERRAIVAQCGANYRPVLEACDFTNPCIYLTETISTPKQALRELRVRRLRIATAIAAAPGRPCIPMVCPYEAPGGPLREWIMLSLSHYLLSQVMPPIEAECEGVALWTGFEFYSLCTTEQKIERKQEMRDAFAINWGPACLDSRTALKTAMGAAMTEVLDRTRDLFGDVHPRLAGDVNRDGVVDAKDLAEVQANWGSRG